jgi:O-antigen biosynthesis protein
MSVAELNPLKHPACLDFPLWLDETAWAEHIPFAMYLISALRPLIFVELGAYRGVSYCAFCQAVLSVNSDTKCFAIDTWEGDEHAGKLEKDVLVKLRAHHDPLYAGFSKLLQKTFDTALTEFADGTIDLLHIDGFHTYDAVKHDFDTWLPKMSNRGIVLFHDISVRKRGFGVWRFWDELCHRFSNFSFSHGNGLGVLLVGTEMPEGIKDLFETDDGQKDTIRLFFQQLGERIEAVNVFHRQSDHIRHFEMHENVVMNSKLMRAYRILKTEGVAGLLRKALKRIHFTGR